LVWAQQRNINVALSAKEGKNKTAALMMMSDNDHGSFPQQGGGGDDVVQQQQQPFLAVTAVTHVDVRAYSKWT
jgi:hypothetical protein